jgi:hypothetical protein
LKSQIKAGANMSLEKKIEAFYRVAVYGDRGSFLKSLAQRAEPDDAIKALNKVTTLGYQALQLILDDKTSKFEPSIMGIVDSLKQTIGKSQDAQGRINPPNAEDVFDLVNKAAGFFGRNPNKAELFKKLNQISIQIQNNLNVIHSAQNEFGLPENNQLVQEQVIDSSITPNNLPNAKPAQSMQKIDPQVQVSLNELGYTPALKVDGLLGPETEKALNWFKKTKGYSNLSLNTLLDMVKYVATEENGPKPTLQPFPEEEQATSAESPFEAPANFLNKLLNKYGRGR